jgi:hypothetical protein
VTRAEALALIAAERDRQTALYGGHHEWGYGDCSSDGVAPIVKAAVLMEEAGEVARAVLDKDPAEVRRELVQVAAVALAWLEAS